MATLLNSKQVVNRAALEQIANDDSLLSDILTSINENLTVPFVISASATPGLTVSLGGSSIQNSQTQKNRTFQPINGLHFDFAGSTITLPASAGGNIINSAGDDLTLTISNSSVNKLLIEMNEDATVTLTLGTEGASVAAAVLPEPEADRRAVGYIIVEADGSGNIQVVENADIYQFLGGGGGGAGASIIKIDQTSHGLSVGDGIYHNGTQWVQGQADDGATLAYYCVVAVDDANTFQAAQFGRIKSVAHGFTVGGFYFLDTENPGAPVNAEPASGYSNPLFYAEDVDTLQVMVYRPAKINDAGSGGGTGGSAGINYIEINDAETGINNWAVYKDAAQEVVEDGIGGSPTITLEANSVTPLRGNADFLITKPASNVQGEGVSYAFTVDEADKHAIIRIQKDIKVSANYASGDARVYVVDEDNGQVIRLSKEDIEDSSLNMKFVTEFQGTGALNYRLVIHMTSTSALAFTVNFDNVEVGPRVIARGPVITDFQSFTPTGSWSSNITYTGKYKRIGDEVLVEYRGVLSNSSEGNQLTINLPPGLVIDTEKILIDLAQPEALPGRFTLREAGVNEYHDNIPMYASTTSFTIHLPNVAGTYPQGAARVNNVTPFSWAAGDYFDGWIRVPVQGWSSNSTISEDFGGRVIAVVAAGNGGTALTGNVTDIDFATVKDTTGSWTGTNFITPESGYYEFSGAILTTSNLSGPGINMFINNSFARRVNDVIGTTTFFTINHTMLHLNRGDVVSFRIDNNVSLAPAAGNHYLNISKIQSPQTLSGGEVVSFSGATNSGQSVPHASTTTIAFEDVDHDTFNSYDTSTGIFTVPVSGKYRISYLITYTLTTQFSGSELALGWIRVDQSVIKQSSYVYPSSNNVRVPIRGGMTLDLVKGQTIDIQTRQTSLATQSLESSDSTFNTLSIEKIN